jgi:uncharacterized protein (TIGR03435 family)
MTMCTLMNRLIYLAVSVACCGLSQSGDPLPEFDAAALHRVAPSEVVPGISNEGGPGTRTPNLFTCRYCTLTMFVAVAFDLKPYQIVVPSALDDEHYMLSARLPPHSSKEDFQGMMRRLLKERFGLSYKMIDKKMVGYALKLTKGGPKFRASVTTPDTDDSTADAGTGQLPRRPPDFKIGKDGFPILPEGHGLSLVSTNGSTRLKSTGETIPEFAAFLSDQMHEPLVDGTKLKGRYDITLTWTPDRAGSLKPADGSQWPPLEEALVSQLGLKLERGKENVQVLVVSHVERIPAVE